MSDYISLRRLTKDGMDKFHSHITNARNDPSLPLPAFMIKDPSYSEIAVRDVQIDLEMVFSDRYELAVYLKAQLGRPLDSLLADVGLWSWLALAYFDQFCPKRGPSKHENYILSIGEWKMPGNRDLSYRHCVRMPVILVDRFEKDTKFFLSGRPMSQMGDVVEQICSRTYLMRSRTSLAVIFHLYQNPSTGAAKPGCTSYSARPKKLNNGNWSQSGRGAVRRLIDGVLPRLSLTYNTELMDVSSLIKASGEEFSDSSWNNP
jgi:hypothetical protein